mmetsp:Transcript_3552/g.5059  ORF Transcript_3552/g.5059 Transcript_3552/m.5059 type:complete len:137 (+) Transcript_3552:269-679(+)
MYKNKASGYNNSTLRKQGQRSGDMFARIIGLSTPASSSGQENDFPVGALNGFMPLQNQNLRLSMRGWRLTVGRSSFRFPETRNPPHLCILTSQALQNFLPGHLLSVIHGRHLYETCTALFLFLLVFPFSSEPILYQ